MSFPLRVNLNARANERKVVQEWRYRRPSAMSSHRG
jgi:hypothetical protein